MSISIGTKNLDNLRGTILSTLSNSTQETETTKIRVNISAIQKNKKFINCDIHEIPHGWKVAGTLGNGEIITTISAAIIKDLKRDHNDIIKRGAP